MDFDEIQSKTMSSVEVSMMTTNHKLERDPQYVNRRPQRSPPPPPIQIQSPPVSASVHKTTNVSSATRKRICLH